MTDGFVVEVLYSQPFIDERPLLFGRHWSDNYQVTLTRSFYFAYNFRKTCQILLFLPSMDLCETVDLGLSCSRLR